MANGIIRDANKYLYKDPDNPYVLPMTVLPYGGLYHKGDNRMSDYDVRATANYSHTFAEKHIMESLWGYGADQYRASTQCLRGSGTTL